MPQLVPAGDGVIVPVPVPLVDSVRLICLTLNAADTPVAVVSVTLHGVVAPQPPPVKPPKVELALGLAAIETVVP